MFDVNALYAELQDYLDELASKFVDKYIPADPAVSPSDYSHDVKAYCVLAHAAFEEFIEAVVLAVIDNAVNKWIKQRTSDDVLIALLCWHGAKLKIDDDENSPETKPFDYLRVLINDAKAAFSQFVRHNHGVSILYLRKLLIPAAIEVKQDPSLLNSLRQLADGRGMYAHKGKVKVVVPPEDAKRYVKDVLLLCSDVRDKAFQALK